MLQANKLTPNTMRRQMFVMMCYAYIFLGVCSIAAGCLVYALPLFLGSKHPKHIDFGMGFLIVVLIGFGMARIGTAILNLRRITRRNKPL
jgi:hypothetical protein